MDSGPDEHTDDGIARGYQVLARSVAGWNVSLAQAGGSATYADGKTLYVGEHADPAETARAVIVQAALLAAGSHDRSLMPRLLRGRRPAVERYLTLEVIRSCHQLRHVLPRSLADSVAGVYRGAVSGSARESIERATGRRERVPAPPAWFGVLKPMKVLRAGPAPGASSPSDNERRGRTREAEVGELGEDSEDAAERSRILELLSAPVGLNPFSAALQRLLGMGRTPSGGDAGAAGELSVAGHRIGPVGSNAKRMQGGRLVHVGDAAGPRAVGVRYPEWNCQKRSYRPGWCSVSELDPAVDGEAGATPPAFDHKLRSELSRLGLTWQRHRRRYHGDDLDLTALVDFRIALAAGGTAEPHVYESRRRTGRDLGVLVLLDATGSTADEAEGCSVFDDQRRLVWQLTASLDQLGERVATYAFYSRGRDNVRFLRVKDFDDRFDHASQRRLLSLKPAGFTRLGAALRHGTELVSTRAGTSSPLLVVVGDGVLYDDGYEGHYAREDSKQALAEAVRRGVGCVGISIRSHPAADALSGIWPGSVRKAVRDSDDLAGHVRGLFKTALRQATANRRTTART